MNPVQITQTLKQTLTDYLLTTFDANKDGKNPELMRKMRESFEAPNALFNGPYLELIYPYKSSLSLNELCKEGVLSEKLLSLPCFNLPNPEPIPPDIPLYEHQVKAIRKNFEGAAQYRHIFGNWKRENGVFFDSDHKRLNR